MVVFFPNADASSYTKNAIKFSGLDDVFARENTVVIGISNDRPVRLVRLRSKHNLNLPSGDQL